MVADWTGLNNALSPVCNQVDVHYRGVRREHLLAIQKTRMGLLTFRFKTRHHPKLGGDEF